MSAPTVTRPVPGPPPTPPPPRVTISCGHCKDRHATVAQVRLCSQRENARGWNKRQQAEA